MDLSKFSKRLKELRESASLTQQALADKASVSLRAVSQWERGIREPSWGNILALGEALGVDCRAFTAEPAERPDAGPGRPRKPEEDSPAPKRPRGRPRTTEAEAAPASFEKSAGPPDRRRKAKD